MKESVKTHVALAVVSLIFGFNYILTKIILHDVPPVAWALYRAILASASLLPFVWSPAIFKAAKQPRVWLAGFFGVNLNILCFTAGMKYTTPSHAALINACVPAITLVFSLIARREKWSSLKAFGIVCAISGVAVLIGQPSGGQLTGDLFILANAISLALFFVISQPLAKEFPAFGLTGFYFLEGTLLIGLYTFATGQWSSGIEALTHAPFSTHMIMLVAAISASTISYVLNNWALRRAVPSQVAAYITTQPITASILGVLILGDHLKPNFVPAFALVAVGLLFSSYKRRA